MKFTILCAIALLAHLNTCAQTDVLSKLSGLKPLASNRSEVEEVLGGKGSVKESSTWYQYPGMSVQAIYSTGRCTDGWLAPRDTLIEISAFFSNRKKLSELKSKINLKKLRKENAFDVLGEEYYFHDEKGVAYGVNQKERTWLTIWYFPSSKASSAKCTPT